MDDANLNNASGPLHSKHKNHMRWNGQSVVSAAGAIAVFAAILFGILAATGVFEENSTISQQDASLRGVGNKVVVSPPVSPPTDIPVAPPAIKLPNTVTPPAHTCEFSEDLTEDIRGDGSFFLRQFINLSDQTVTVQLEYNVYAWIGFAFSESSDMVVNTAVIGLPDENLVQKYSLTKRELAGVNQLESSAQTLTATSIEQRNGKTILQFTKRIAEADELSVDSTKPIRYIWALGKSNTLGIHEAKGSAVLSFSTCFGEPPTQDFQPPSVITQAPAVSPFPSTILASPSPSGKSDLYTSFPSYTSTWTPEQNVNTVSPTWETTEYPLGTPPPTGFPTIYVRYTEAPTWKPTAAPVWNTTPPTKTPTYFPMTVKPTTNPTATWIPPTKPPTMQPSKTPRFPAIAPTDAHSEPWGTGY